MEDEIKTKEEMQMKHDRNRKVIYRHRVEQRWTMDEEDG